MRKDRDGEKKIGEKRGKKRKRIVATTSFPAVDLPNANCWNAARLWQFEKKRKELIKRSVFLIKVGPETSC